MSFIKLPNGTYIRIDQITAVRVCAAIDTTEMKFPDRVVVDLTNYNYERCDCASSTEAKRLADWIIGKIS